MDGEPVSFVSLMLEFNMGGLLFPCSDEEYWRKSAR